MHGFKRVLPAVTALFLVLTTAGCAPVISKALLDQVDKTVEFGALLETPENYVGKVVVLGGMIVSAKNQPEGTLLEVVQKPLDFMERPEPGDESSGRFLALYGEYLDPAIYAAGREVTVAGPVEGKRVMPLGEISYAYPLIMAREVHLWPQRKDEAPYYYPPGYGYNLPWWWHHPYGGPWW